MAPARDSPNNGLVPSRNWSSRMVHNSNSSSNSSGSSGEDGTTLPSLASLAFASSSSSPSSSPSSTTKTSKKKKPTRKRRLDFVGSAVKDLFALPYRMDESVNVAIHNVGGTLLLDRVADAELIAVEEEDKVEFEQQTINTLGQGIIIERNNNKQQQQHNRELTICQDNNKKKNAGNQNQINNSRAGVSGLKLLMDHHHHQYQPIPDEDHGNINKEALSLVNSLVQQQQQHNTHHHHSVATKQQQETSTKSKHETSAAGATTATATEPREYVECEFHDMNLLVGSQALVYRGHNAATAAATTSNAKTHSSTALTIRVEDATQLQSMVRQHQQQWRVDNNTNPSAAVAKPSYAEAASTTAVLADPDHLAEKAMPLLPFPEHHAGLNWLQPLPNICCMIPTPHTAVVPPSHDASTSKTTTMTPLTAVVLDTYLDNILANVPQLALCLQDKGLVRSVKLLSTPDIPAAYLQSDTSDISVPVQVVQAADPAASADPVFSPEIMEMNAATLLHFLQTHCTSQDSATYLLRRPANSRELRLYHCSATANASTTTTSTTAGTTTTPRRYQKQWKWRLAMLSYKFANRLGHLAAPTTTATVVSNQNHKNSDDPPLMNAGTRRSFRSRQRSLLHTTLELLESINEQEEDDAKKMPGNRHESFMAAIREQLADTFLQDNNNSSSSSSGKSGNSNTSFATATATTNSTSTPSKKNTTTTSPKGTATASPLAKPPLDNSDNNNCSEASNDAWSHQRIFADASVDALNKAQDHIEAGIHLLWPLLEDTAFPDRVRRRRQQQRRQSPARKNPGSAVVSVAVDNDESDDEGDSGREMQKIDVVQKEALATQLLGLHHKLTNVSLRLFEIHLKSYYSSSAMQAIRSSARSLAKAIFLARLLFPDSETGAGSSPKYRSWQQQLRMQYAWLWNCGGHFARSFASDPLWRDRGHASGDDVVSVLCDARDALADPNLFIGTIDPLNLGKDPVVANAHGMIHLGELSGLVRRLYSDDTTSSQAVEPLSVLAVQAARARLDTQKLLSRDQRRVLVAASIAYSRALRGLEVVLEVAEDGFSTLGVDSSHLAVQEQRLGDASNETGKVILNELRVVLSVPDKNPGDETDAVAEPLLLSAEFWFSLGVDSFEKCKDVRNLALLRCNLCQCYKLRANSRFASPTTASSTSISGHAEACLEKAIHCLELAHSSMDNREVEPGCWDMVSNELAATFLVLGVRRRQSLLGSRNTPVLLQALRLSPGHERSIIEPMERALSIYEDCGNLHQAAAARYQLALFFAQVWTCQRDETKTKEKLSAAFRHYSGAHAYFSRNVAGNEESFCLLCMDLAGLYAVVAGEECLFKAMSRCLEASEAFSRQSIETQLQKLSTRSSWMDNMSTLASTIEERVFKHLRSLVKIDQGKYKDLYKEALAAKMTESEDNVEKPNTGDRALDDNICRIVGIYSVLSKIAVAASLQG